MRRLDERSRHRASRSNSMTAASRAPPAKSPAPGRTVVEPVRVSRPVRAFPDTRRGPDGQCLKLFSYDLLRRDPLALAARGSSYLPMSTQTLRSAHHPVRTRPKRADQFTSVQLDAKNGQTHPCLGVERIKQEFRQWCTRISGQRSKSRLVQRPGRVLARQKRGCPCISGNGIHMRGSARDVEKESCTGCLDKERIGRRDRRSSREWRWSIHGPHTVRTERCPCARGFQSRQHPGSGRGLEPRPGVTLVRKRRRDVQGGRHEQRAKAKSAVMLG
jgi:hypothetical protein